MNQKILSKLFKVQNKLNPIKKSMDNPFFSSKYFDINKLLEEIMPVLHECGLGIMQPLTTTEDGRAAIETILYDDEGNYLSRITPLPAYSKAHEMGSCVTYLRRYSIQSLIGLQAEDDDGNLATYPDGFVKSKPAGAPRRTYSRKGGN